MKFIVAVDITGEKYGIGHEGKLNWVIPDDLKFFKKKTMHKNVVVGHKTYIHLPVLKDRHVMILSNSKKGNDYYTLDELKKAIPKMESVSKDSVVIIGGKQVYELSMNDHELEKQLTGGWITEITFHDGMKNNTYDTDLKEFCQYVQENFSVVDEVVLLENDFIKVVAKEYAR